MKKVDPINDKHRYYPILTALILACMLIFVSCSDKEERQEPTTETHISEQITEPSSESEADPDELFATVFFASDYQHVERLQAPSENIAQVLDKMAFDGISPDMAVLCGDYTNDRLLHDYQMSPEDAISEIKSTIGSRCPQMKTDEMIFVQGNHDKLTESISDSGLHEFRNFLVYVLNTQNDFPWKQGKTSGCLSKVKKAADDMKACFEELKRREEKRPVFIAAHVPIHFTARTSSKHTTGDNLYSSLIFDAINEGAKSLDIVYFYGHNHSKGWDCYMGGSCVFKAKGDTVLIPSFDEKDVNTDEYTEEKLNFTYLNAGYIGYYMNCGPEEYDAGKMSDYEAADGTLSATVCRIYPDRIQIDRYACSEDERMHQLGSAGEGDPYKGGIDKELIGKEHYSMQTDSPVTIPRNTIPRNEL